MKHYVYRHIRPDKNVPFYIGIGLKPENYFSEKREYFRAYATGKSRRSSFWYSTWLKCNKQIDVDILYESDNVGEIKEKEIEFILLYGRKNIGTGSLVNLTDGGDGCEGYRHTEAHKKKMRVSRLGKKFPEETRAKMRRPKSEEAKQTMRNNHADYTGAKHPRAKSVFQYSKSGEFIKEWKCIRDVENVLGINHGNISACCLGKLNFYGGFIWKHNG